jgi:replicative DNA helicase
MVKKEISEKASAKQAERVGLAALLHHNDFIPEVMALFKPTYFNWQEHQTIYSVITTLYQERGLVDQTILTGRLIQLGLKEVNGLETPDYVQSFYNLPVNREAILDYFREIYKMHSCRKAFSALGRAQGFINSNLDKPLGEILAGVQDLTSESLAANIEERVKFVKVYRELPAFLEDRAKKKDSSYLKTGYKNFDYWYGGILMRGTYVFAAPAKVGKSTLLNYLAYQMCCIPENKLRVLILDTELESEFAQSRAISALTNINEFEFLEGEFAKNAEYAQRTKKALADISEQAKERIDHVYVGNMSIDEILSIARRWYITQVKKGENALIVYDYIKLAGGESSLSDHWKEYQEIGEKTDKLKKFSSNLGNAALLTSVQTNEQGKIGMSSQIKWFANNVFILQRKTLEQLQEDGKENGTHFLVEVVTRNLGRGGGQHSTFEVRTEDRVVNQLQNWINFKFLNFHVTEVNTRQDIYSQRASQLEAEPGYDSGQF